MTEFKKSDLLETLNEIDDMLTLSLASITYFHRDKELKMLSEHWMMHFGRVWNLRYLADELRNPNKKAKRLNDFSWIVKKFLLREPYTIIDEYCRLNNQTAKLREQDWFQFAKIIRNFVTHNFLDPGRYSKSIFPVRWKQYVINWDEIETSKIILHRFGIKMPMELFNEIKQFAEKLSDD